MRIIEKNIQDGDDIRELCENLLEAVHAVVSNTLRFGDMEDGDEKAPCMALYTVIGISEAMLQAFPKEYREKARKECEEYFSGEYERKRQEAASQLVSRIFGL